MYSERYGDLRDVAAHTDGACHLCHQPVDLALYGPTGAFGDDTANVDHLIPQSFGGDDELENLRIAHGTCNSIRGIRHVHEARLELAGTVRAPMSSGEKTTWSVGGGTLAALIAGYAFGEPMPDGSRKFNGGAAIVGGLALGMLLRAAL